MSSPLPTAATSSGGSTPQTERALATGNTRTDTLPISLSANERRAAYQAGLTRGAATYFNSPTMEQLALELTLAKATVAAVSDAAMQRERLLLHWQNEARWWQEEYGRLSAEYTAFVKAVARLGK